jgi:Soluble lytic murein transglycosylase and related regulatory proteins (some contain LysM/invasin domains)
MNYSRNLRKAAIAKRAIILCCITAIVSLLVGYGTGYAMRTHITAISELETEEQAIEPMTQEFALYGAYDNEQFTGEVSLDWDKGNLDFTPLDVDMDEDLQEFVFYLSSAYDIDFTLVMALIQQESNFQSNLISSTNDYGLMQINQINHEYITKTIGVTNFLDPFQNVRAGTFILRKLFEKYQDTKMVLMAYNMGEGGAARLWSQGIYETNYTQTILKIQQQFNEQLEGD